MEKTALRTSSIMGRVCGGWGAVGSRAKGREERACAVQGCAETKQAGGLRQWGWRAAGGHWAARHRRAAGGSGKDHSGQ